MAAIGAVATLLQSGDHVIVTDNTYGGTFRLFDKVLRRYQLEFSYVDTSQPELIEQALRPNTRLLFVETPTNPVMRLTDLARAAEIARKANVRMVVDNTFASPYVQRPLELGADLVVHSTTKYLNGHSDSIGGIVVATPRRRHRVAGLRPERRGGHPQPDGLVAGAARHEDARRPHGAAQQERPGALPNSSRRTRRCSACSTPACRPTRSTSWRSGR